MPEAPQLNLSATGDLTISGDVVGRDKIVQHITQIYERAKTAVEEAAQAQAAEAKVLAEGVLAVAARLQARASDTAAFTETNPYKGLLEYRLSDAEFFFGREQAIRELLQQLERGTLTVLHSESGAGKTSLLQAGLAPRLLAHAHLPLYLRPYNSEPQYVIKRAFISDPSLTPELSTAPLRDFLRRVTEVLGEKRYLFICLDQFEEFFTQLSAPEREEFVRELAECMDDATLNVRWILALRTEYFGNLANFRPRIQNPFENDFRLNRLTREEARVVITAPAERVGLRYEAGLVDNILDDLGQKEIAPPQMQLVCSALFEELKPEEKVFTQELYEREGRAAGILRGHLERVLSRDLPGPQRAAARRLLESLISSEQQRVVRTHAELVAELTAKGISAQTLDVILSQLVNSRLLRPHESESGEVSYELSHDYLLGEINLDPEVQARKAAQELLEQEIRAFRRYQTLLNADRLNVIEPYLSGITLTEEARQLLEASRAAVQKEKLEEEARRQKELEDARKLAESEKQRAEERTQAAQRLQTRNRLVTGVGVVAGILAVIAFVLFGQANSAREEANMQRNMALTQQAIAVTEQARAEAEAQRAETEAQRAEDEARLARIGLSGQLAAQAQSVLKDNQPQTAVLLAIEALSVTRRVDEPDVPQAQTALQSGLFAMNTVGLGEANALSADRRWLAVSAAEGSQLRLFRTDGPTPTTPVQTLKLEAGQQVGENLTFTADNGWLISEINTDTEIRLTGWRQAAGEFSEPVDFGAAAAQADDSPLSYLSPNGQWLLVRSDPPTLFDLSAADPLAAPLILQDAPVNVTYQFTADSQWLLATQTRLDFTQTEALLRAWAMNAPNPAEPRLAHNQPNTTDGFLAVNEAARTIAFAFRDADAGRVNVSVFDLSALSPRQTLMSEDAGRISALSSVGRWLVTLDSESRFLRLWDTTRPGSPPLEISGPQLVDSLQTWRLSPDGRWLITYFTRETGVGAETASAIVWDLSLENPLTAPAHNFLGEPITNIVTPEPSGELVPRVQAPWFDFTFSPDARFLILTEDSTRSFIYDLQAEQPFARNWALFISEPKDVTPSGPFFTFSPDGRWVALDVGENSQVWDLSQLQPESTSLGSQRIAGSPRGFSPDGQWLIYSGERDFWWLYDLTTRADIKITGHDIILFKVDFAANNRALISTDWGGYTRWLEMEHAPVGHRLAVVAADDTHAVTLRGDRACVWDLSQPTLPAPLIFEHMGARVTSAALSPNNRWLVTYATDQQLRLWDLAAPRPTAAPLFIWPFTSAEPDVLTDLRFNANGQWLLFATSAGSTLWAAEQFASNGAASFQPTFTFPAEFLLQQLTADGRWALGVFSEGELTTPVAYDLRQPTASPTPLNTSKSISAVSPNGRWLTLVDFFTFSSADASIEVRDLSALPNTEALLPQNLFVQDGGFSADSRWLGFYGTDAENQNLAYIYRLDETPRLHAVLPSEEPVQGQAFTPDGAAYLRFFFGEALLTRLSTPDAPPQTLQGFSLSSPISPPAYQFDISADSRLLAFNDFYSLRIWDLMAPDQAPATLGLAENSVALRFSAGHHWLVLDEYENVRFISLEVEALRALACQAAGRNFTSEEWATYFPGQPYQVTCPMWAAEP